MGESSVSPDNAVLRILTKEFAFAYLLRIGGMPRSMSAFAR